MSVFLTDDEIKTFANNGFSESDLQNTINGYRSEGLDDNAIRGKIDQRLKGWSTVTNTQPEPTTTPTLTAGVEKNYTQNWDKKGRVYYTDKSGNKVRPASSVGGLQKIGRKLQAIGSNVGDWLNETNPESKSYQQKINTALALETLPAGLGANATKAIATKLTPVVGKKIAQNAAQGFGGGLVGSAAFGAGNALIEGENPLAGAAIGGALGAPFGLGLGVAGGYIGRLLAKNKIRPLAGKTNLSPQEEKLINNYYADYERGKNVINKNNEIAKINDVQTNFNPPENNYFGAAAKQAETPLGVETKQTKLTQTMKEKGTLPEELKGINAEYEVLHNADIANQATEALNKDPNKVLGELQQKAFNKDSELSALDFETARQTVSKLYQEGRIDEALALTEQISQKASKAGQSVQALSLWSKTTPEGAVRYAQKVISDYNKTAKNKLPLLNEQQADEIMALAQNTQMSEIGTRENNIANQLLLKYIKGLVPVSTGSKLRSLQNISLLLNPKTFGRNIGGNAIFAGLENFVTKPIAAGLDKLASKFTGVRTRVRPQIKEYGQGLQQGFKEGVEDVNLGINTRGKLGTRFNLNDRPSFENVPVLGEVEKALNYSLQVPDRMFYQAAYNESIANQMRAAGVAQPTSKMVEQATQDALESVYQNSSALGNAALNLRQAGNKILNLNGYGLGDAFIPYAQTPANIAQQGINYSPLGFVKGFNNALSGNQRQATLDVARAITGSGLMGLGALGAQKGIINPALEDYRVRKNYEALGLRPNTVNLGDYNVSFNQLQPLSGPILGGAALNDIQNGDYKKSFDRSLGSVIDLGMLQTANKFMADMNDEGLGTATANLVSSIPSRFVPTALKQVNDLIDNTQRDTSDANILKQGINQAIAKVPLVSNMLPVKYDITGQPMKKYQTEGLQRVIDATINPVFVNKRKKDATIQELVNLYERTGDKSALLPLADKKVQYKDLQGAKVVRPLNAKERNEYQHYLGVFNKQTLDDIINSDFYNSLDDVEKINFINSIQRYIKSYVDEKLWGKPNIQTQHLAKQLLDSETEREKRIRDILKMYKYEIVPLKVEMINQENF